MNHRFVLISRWPLATTRERAWAVLTAPETWPRWWPALASVRCLEAGGPDGIGAVREFRWHSGVGYRITFAMATVRVGRLREIEGAASGDVRGQGLWLLEDAGAAGIFLTYRWAVDLERPWLRLAAPLLRPLFIRRHFAVMRSGARGMARHLDCAIGKVEEWAALPGGAGL